MSLLGGRGYSTTAARAGRSTWRVGDGRDRRSSSLLVGPALALLRDCPAVDGALDRLGLQVPTAASPHQIDGLLSIDHIAVPADWRVLDIEHHPALSDGDKISDHDAYVIEASE